MHFPKLRRLPELDALRGLFLVWMTLTHLPTRFSDFVNQPFGYISSAEGFVFLSALLIGRLYIRKSMEDPAGVRAQMWKRSLKLYAYHMFLLAFAFTVAASWAVHAPVSYTHLDVYKRQPAFLEERLVLARKGELLPAVATGELQIASHGESSFPLPVIIPYSGFLVNCRPNLLSRKPAAFAPQTPCPQPQIPPGGLETI